MSTSTTIIEGVAIEDHLLLRVKEYSIFNEDGTSAGNIFTNGETPTVQEGQDFVLVHEWIGSEGGAWMVRGHVTDSDAWVNERSVSHDERPWRPFRETRPIRPDGTTDETVAAGEEEFWANSHFLVFRRELKALKEGAASAIYLSLRTIENDTRHDWREFQRVKNELAGRNWEGVELYPDMDRVVDQANQYHLWCFPFRMPFGFDESETATPEEAEEVGSKQRAGVVE